MTTNELKELAALREFKNEVEDALHHIDFGMENVGESKIRYALAKLKDMPEGDAGNTAMTKQKADEFNRVLDAYEQPPTPQPAPASVVPDIKSMVDRFLGWKLPKSFSPDAGISFKPIYNESSPFGPVTHEPTGTNLFNADETKAMFEYCLAAVPASVVPEDIMKDALRYRFLRNYSFDGDYYTKVSWRVSWNGVCFTKEKLDEAIDAAIAAAPKQGEK